MGSSMSITLRGLLTFALAAAAALFYVTHGLSQAAALAAVA